MSATAPPQIDRDKAKKADRRRAHGHFWASVTEAWADEAEDTGKNLYDGHRRALICHVTQGRTLSLSEMNVQEMDDAARLAKAVVRGDFDFPVFQEGHPSAFRGDESLCLEAFDKARETLSARAFQAILWKLPSTRFLIGSPLDLVMCLTDADAHRLRLIAQIPEAVEAWDAASQEPGLYVHRLASCLPVAEKVNAVDELKRDVWQAAKMALPPLALDQVVAGCKRVTERVEVESRASQRDSSVG